MNIYVYILTHILYVCQVLDHSRSIFYGPMTFCRVADSPKIGAQQQRLLGERSHLGLIHLEVGRGRLPEVLGAWWFLGIAWWKTSSHVFFQWRNCQSLGQSICSTNLAPEERSNYDCLATEHTSHVILHVDGGKPAPVDLVNTLQTTELQPSQLVLSMWNNFWKLSKLPGSSDLCTKTSWLGNACAAPTVDASTTMV